jgi:hypothetical protein
MRRLRLIRVPTAEEFAAYRGEQCFALWRRVGSSFVCPCCSRTKFQLLRWTARAARPLAGEPLAFRGWMAGLHTHHDHEADRDGVYHPELARFEATVICDQCNAADGRAKRALVLPKSFSFAPDEIARFVIATAHASHRLRLDVALRIFKELRGVACA